MGGAGRRLVADIGGTNARFALADAEGAIAETAVLPVAGYATFADALAAYVARTGARFDAAAIAAAGPRDGDRIRLTNAAWTIDAAAALAAGARSARVFNDLEAVALALPHLDADGAERLVAGAPAPTSPLLALNVGTGLGAALALPTAGGDWRALATEAGHMRFAPLTPEEAAFADEAHVYEDLLSGRGFQCQARRLPDAAARRGVFSALLGRVAGDLVLATGAWGGVYFCGGVLGDWAANVDFQALHARFLDKGAMSARMGRVPLWRLTLEAPALVGLAHAPL